MYLVDFADKKVIVARYVPCLCLGELNSCNACGGSGYYPLSTTKLGVLISDKLFRELIAQDLPALTPYATLWPQRLLGNVQRLWSLAVQHAARQVDDPLIVSDEVMSGLERLAQSAQAAESLLSVEVVISP